MVSDQLISLVKTLTLTVDQQTEFMSAITQVAHMESLLAVAARAARDLSETLRKYRDEDG